MSENADDERGTTREDEDGGVSYEELSKAAMAAGALDDEITEDEAEVEALLASGADPHLDPYEEDGEVFDGAGFFFYEPVGMVRFQSAAAAFLLAALLVVPILAVPIIMLSESSGSSGSTISTIGFFVILAVLIGLPLRASMSYIHVEAGNVTVKNPLRTYWFRSNEVELVFKTMGDAGTAGWVPYGSPSGDGATVTSMAKRLALVVKATGRVVRIRAMRARTQDSIETMDLAAALTR